MKSTSQKRLRQPKNVTPLTALGLMRMKPPKQGQVLYWDATQIGLSLLVGKRTKTFRSQFKLRGTWTTRSLGRLGELVTEKEFVDAKTDEMGAENFAKLTATERARLKIGMEIAKARKLTENDRALALKNKDPRPSTEEDYDKALTYGEVVDRFIELYAKPRQRTWQQTERALKGPVLNTDKKKRAPKVERTDARHKWLNRPFADITKKDARLLLEGFVAEGNGPKAVQVLAWLRTLWRWAYKRDLVSGPLMDGVEIHVEKNERDRVFTDEEIASIWRAADKLDQVAGSYVKTLVLLAPRKSALSGMRWSELDDIDTPTLWTTPHERTKTRKTAKKRTYLTPLPRIVQRILKALPKRDDDLVFPGKGQATSIKPGSSLIRRLALHGAPADFRYHTARHSLATWLQTQGHSDFEIGLVLNHSRGGVTAGYLHGSALELKRTLLNKWADHVERLVQPSGAKLLR